MRSAYLLSEHIRMEFTELIGIDDSEWKYAKQFKRLLRVLHQQRRKDMDTQYGNYPFAARLMFKYTFGTVPHGPDGSFYNPDYKSLWYVSKKVRKKPPIPCMKFSLSRSLTINSYHMSPRSHQVVLEKFTTHTT